MTEDRERKSREKRAHERNPRRKLGKEDPEERFSK
jgi:hypothetical protein